MENKYIALSLFNGMGCAFEALKKANISVSMKISSEIDKYATIVNQANHPDTIQLGDVKCIYFDSISRTLSNGSVKIQLPDDEIILLGGSPCQSFSFAGKRKGMATKCETEILTLDHYLQLKNDGFEFEGQSYLFWEYMRILKEVKPKYFLLENVEMGEKWEKVLSKAIGVNGIHINSALVSAQNRRRIYWLGQIRERLYYNDNLCYICRKDEYDKEAQQGLLGEAQGEGEIEVLEGASLRQSGLQNMQQRVFQNDPEGNNKNLLDRVPETSKKTERQESGQRKKGDLLQGLCRKEQGEDFTISEGLQENRKREGSIKTERKESIEKNRKNNENPSSPGVNWNKEEAEKRRTDYYSKYGKDMCCVQCGKKLDHRPHRSIVERWDKSNYEPTSPLSEVQFNEARQNNGRVFDILEVGIKGIDSLFGETISEIPQPKDKGILLKDILEKEVDEKYYLSGAAVKRMIKTKYSKPQINPIKTGTLNTKNNSGQLSYDSGTTLVTAHEIFDGGKTVGKEVTKSHSLLMRDYKGFNNFGMTGVIVHNTMPRSSKTGKGGTGPLSRNDGSCLDTGQTNAVEIVAMRGRNPENPKSRVSGLPTEQRLEPRSDQKTNCLTSVQKDNLVREVKQLNLSTESGGKQPYQQNRVYDEDGISPALDLDSSRKSVYTNSRIRRLTPLECERLQTVPDGYTNVVSDSQRYKMLGNGWTIDVIVHIFNYIK